MFCTFEKRAALAHTSKRLTMSWLAWRSLASAFSPVSRDRPTVTMKFTPILDFMEMGGLVSSAEQKKTVENVVFGLAFLECGGCHC